MILRTKECLTTSPESKWKNCTPSTPDSTPSASFKPDSLDRVRGDRSLARRSGFMARRVRKLAQKARELKLADEIEVVFPDENLEAAVREKLEKPEGPLTRGDVKRLQELHTRNQMIGDLSGASSMLPT